MKPNELARRLNGIELTDISDEISREADHFGLVVVYGFGRELVTFLGAIDDEIDVLEGGPIHLDADGVLPNADDVSEEDQAAYYDRKRLSYLIDADYQQNGYQWSFTTAIPHHRFEVLNDGARYCRGIVFDKAMLGTGGAA
jgi:hypothetical protein